MAALTLPLLTARAKTSDFAQIKQLNLWGCSLSDIQLCENLTEVEILAFTGNEISTLAPLANCLKLRELYLRKNNIKDMDELNYVMNLPNLEVLCLTENPCCELAGDDYREMVLGKLPRLKKLDTIVVKKDEVNAALKKYKPGTKRANETEPLEKFSKQDYAQLTPISKKDLSYNESYGSYQSRNSVDEYRRRNSSPVNNSQNSLLNAVLSLIQQLDANNCDAALRIVESMLKERRKFLQ